MRSFITPNATAEAGVAVRDGSRAEATPRGTASPRIACDSGGIRRGESRKLSCWAALAAAARHICRTLRHHLFTLPRLKDAEARRAALLAERAALTPIRSRRARKLLQRYQRA